jgi:hypothetical protein
MRVDVQARPMPTAIAASMVVAVFVLLYVSNLAIDQLRLRDDVPTLGGFGWFLPWLLYPGLTAWIAVRAVSEPVVTVLAMLLPALVLALSIARPPLDMVDVGYPLAAAAGVFFGMWAGTDMMRRVGHGGTAAGFVAASLAGLVSAALVGLPALATPGFMEPMV